MDNLRRLAVDLATSSKELQVRLLGGTAIGCPAGEELDITLEERVVVDPVSELWREA